MREEREIGEIDVMQKELEAMLTRLDRVDPIQELLQATQKASLNADLNLSDHDSDDSEEYDSEEDQEFSLTPDKKLQSLQTTSKKTGAKN